ncbi:MAG: hypothetical protein OXQ29_27815 [Rhodospirillaceae bacterium]|nr:hypothetical protein [Rhodospirillaceae bacterium]
MAGEDQMAGRLCSEVAHDLRRVASDMQQQSLDSERRVTRLETIMETLAQTTSSNATQISELAQTVAVLLDNNKDQAGAMDRLEAIAERVTRLEATSGSSLTYKWLVGAMLAIGAAGISGGLVFLLT